MNPGRCIYVLPVLLHHIRILLSVSILAYNMSQKTTPPHFTAVSTLC